jgi:hypothetical protein
MKLRGCSGSITVGGVTLVAQDIDLDTGADVESFAGEDCSLEKSVGPIDIRGSCNVVVDTAVNTATLLPIGTEVVIDVQSQAGVSGSTGTAIVTNKRKRIPRRQGMQEVAITFEGTNTGAWVLDF